MQIRKDVMDKEDINNNEKAVLLFKCYFVVYLNWADKGKISALYKHMFGEKYYLSYKGIIIKFHIYDTSIPDSFMNAHTCFKSLDLNIHES